MIQHSSIRNCIKYLAYADDFATIVRDIWKNSLALLNIIQQFDRIANLRISWKKSSRFMSRRSKTFAAGSLLCSRLLLLPLLLFLGSISVCILGRELNAVNGMRRQ